MTLWESRKSPRRHSPCRPTRGQDLPDLLTVTLLSLAQIDQSHKPICLTITDIPPTHLDSGCPILGCRPLPFRHALPRGPQKLQVLWVVLIGHIVVFKFQPGISRRGIRRTPTSHGATNASLDWLFQSRIYSQTILGY